MCNQGSARPKGSATICKGFRLWSVKNKNNLTCEIMHGESSHSVWLYEHRSNSLFEISVFPSIILLTEYHEH